MGSPEDDISAILQAMGIAAQSAASYASALVADGFDTASAFQDLSLQELKDDFGFKRGHLRMVEKGRTGAAVTLVPSSSLTAVEPEPLSESVPPNSTPKLMAHEPASVEPASAVDTVHSAQNISTRSPAALHVIFGSMRFPAPPEALILQAALAQENVDLRILDLKGGADITKEVCEHYLYVRGARHYIGPCSLLYCTVR